jgi:hypothetical protein
LIVVGVPICANTMAARVESVVVVEVGVMRSGSGFRSGKCGILVELFCTPTTDNRCDDEYQYCDSGEPDHGKGTGDSSGVLEETFAAGVGIHESGGSGSGSDDGGDDDRITVGNGEVS